MPRIVTSVAVPAVLEAWRAVRSDAPASGVQAAFEAVRSSLGILGLSVYEVPYVRAPPAGGGSGPCDTGAESRYELWYPERWKAFLSALGPVDAQSFPELDSALEDCFHGLFRHLALGVHEDCLDDALMDYFYGLTAVRDHLDAVGFSVTARVVSSHLSFCRGQRLLEFFDAEEARESAAHETYLLERAFQSSSIWGQGEVYDPAPPDFLIGRWFSAAESLATRGCGHADWVRGWTSRFDAACAQRLVDLARLLDPETKDLVMCLRGARLSSSALALRLDHPAES